MTEEVNPLEVLAKLVKDSMRPLDRNPLILPTWAKKYFEGTDYPDTLVFESDQPCMSVVEALKLP